MQGNILIEIKKEVTETDGHSEGNEEKGPYK